MKCTATTNAGRRCQAHAVGGSSPPRCVAHGGANGDSPPNALEMLTREIEGRLNDIIALCDRYQAPQLTGVTLILRDPDHPRTGHIILTNHGDDELVGVAELLDAVLSGELEGELT